MKAGLDASIAKKLHLHCTKNMFLTATQEPVVMIDDKEVKVSELTKEINTFIVTRFN